MTTDFAMRKYFASYTEIECNPYKLTHTEFNPTHSVTESEWYYKQALKAFQYYQFHIFHSLAHIIQDIDIIICGTHNKNACRNVLIKYPQF